MGTKSSAAKLKLLLNVRPRKASSMEARAATSSLGRIMMALKIVAAPAARRSTPGGVWIISLVS